MIKTADFKKSNSFALLASCFLLLFIFSCSEEEKTKALTPAKLEKPYNNTSFKKGQELTVSFTVNLIEEIEEIKVFTRDTVLFKGTPNKNNYSIQLNTNNWKLGSTQISLEAKLTNGRTRKDHRVVRVLSDIYPTDYTLEVVKTFPHSTSNYTQGLEFDNGILYEGTGGMGATGGKSFLVKLDYKTGEELLRKELDQKDFGEGITILNNKVYQLTWQQNTCFVYDKNTFEELKTFSYSGEGWGLCNNGEYLIMSDGTERLYVRDPSNFALKKTIEVYSNTGPVRRLNELEYINGKIYANVYQSNDIMIINPKTGAVEGIVDASLVALDYRENGEVLNGIAYKKSEDRLFITGKNWPYLIEVKKVKL